MFIKEKKIYFLFAAALALTLSLGALKQDDLVGGNNVFVSEETVALPQEIADQIRARGGDPAQVRVHKMSEAEVAQAESHAQSLKASLVTSVDTNEEDTDDGNLERSVFFECAKAAAQKLGGEGKPSPSVVYDTEKEVCFVIGSDGTLTPLEE